MTSARSLLIVDDDGVLREMLVSLFEERGYAALGASSANAALDLVHDREFDAVLSDIKMPGKSGIEMVGELRQVRPEMPVVLMTAFGSIDSAVEAMQAGALDYVTKPFESEAVLLAIERAIERRVLVEENRALRRAVEHTAGFGDLIGESAAMQEVFSLIRRVAHGRTNVLVTGESGTGKEVVARTLHFHGSRAEQPFVPVNCTAIPEGLLESELFGHVRGAFTGATSSKRGLFEKANGGTLFLDEIGDMGPAIQAKLLRVLQDREIRPVGGTQVQKVDVRIITATHRDLLAEIEAGNFREDLYYRLNVVPIHIPPLRERPEDIPALVRGFIERHAEGRKRTMSDAAVSRLALLPWKGNARELENLVERSLALSDATELSVDDLPLTTLEAGRDNSQDLVLADLVGRDLTLHDLEELYIDEVLRVTNGNKVRATRILGIDRKTLYRRLERRENPKT